MPASPVKSVPADSPTRSRRAFVDRGFGGILAGIVLFAAVVRVTTLGVEDYWLDELHALLDSAGGRGAFEALPVGEILHDLPRCTDLTADCSWGAVWRDMRNDSHPPLYFLLLHGWRRLVGDGELLVRLPSTVFSALSVIPLALILRELGRPRAGLVAALLLSVAYAHVLIGQQARPYSLAVLLVSSSFALLIMLERRGEGLGRLQKTLCWSAYGVLVALAMLTHYFAGLALLGQAVYVLLRLRGAALRNWAIALGCAGLVWALLWLPGFCAQWGFIAGQDWVADAGPGRLARTLIRAMDLPVRMLLATRLPNWSSPSVIYPALLGLLLLVGSIVAVWRCRTRVAAVFLCWYLVPCISLALLDALTSKQLLTHLRYSSVALPGLVGLVVLAASCLRRPMPAVLAGIAAVAIALTLRLPALPSPQARVAAQLLQTQLRPGDLLVFDAQGWIPLWVRRDLVQVTYYMPALACDVLMLNAAPPPETVARLGGYERIFVVSPRIDAVPHPAPGIMQLAGRSEYIRDIGWIYSFARTAGQATTTQP